MEKRINKKIAPIKKIGLSKKEKNKYFTIKKNLSNVKKSNNLVIVMFW